jgi:hypothetical protein
MVASRNPKHCRAVLSFPMRTSHAPGTTLNALSDAHQCKDVLEHLQPMGKKGYKIYFSDKYTASNASGSDGWKELLKDLAITGMYGAFYLIGIGSYKDCCVLRTKLLVSRHKEVTAESQQEVVAIHKEILESFFPTRIRLLVQ